MHNDSPELITRTGPPALPPPLPPPLPHYPYSPGPRPPVVRYPVEFTGRAGEFFGIWFVNLVLSVLTLGIYSAWAKVRTERYFYGNTLVAGSPFEYLANPIAILKGRLLAYAVAITLGLSAHFRIMSVYLVMFALILLLLPWLIQRTLRFRARYSAWRGLRFRFVDGVFEAYVNFMFRPALQIVTLYLVLPWVRMCQQEYMVAGHRFGGKRFGFRGDVGSYYIPFLITMGLGFGAYLLIIFLAMGAVMLGGSASGQGEDPANPASTGALVAVFLPMILVYLGFLALPVFLRTRYTNLMWKYSNLGPHRFESTLRARDVIWIYFSNGILIVLSVGLLVPWAMVRLARYRAAHFALLLEGGVDDFVAESERDESAASSELVDALDLDMDLSI